MWLCRTMEGALIRLASRVDCQGRLGFWLDRLDCRLLDRGHWNRFQCTSQGYWGARH